MKTKWLALIAGVAFLLLGIAGFAEMIAMLPTYSVVLSIGGVLFILFGVSGRRAIVPPHAPGHDMRDLGGI